MQEVQLGQYGVPVILTVLLMVIYNYTSDTLGNRAKPLIAIGVGVVLSLLAIKYNKLDYTFINIVDHVFYGIMMGCSSVGLYKVQQSFRKKPPVPKD